uniref:Uncharacterized protein n=1 Tax=Helianthus annuus TaxID=4232 RepID=A0A251VDN2_HELAN
MIYRDHDVVKSIYAHQGTSINTPCLINRACSWSSSSTTFLLSPLPFLLWILGRLKPNLRGTRSSAFFALKPLKFIAPKIGYCLPLFQKFIIICFLMSSGLS